MRGMHGRGACVAGGHVWQGGVYGRGACVARWGMYATHTPPTPADTTSGRYASYWNAFLFKYAFAGSFRFSLFIKCGVQKIWGNILGVL